MSVINIRGFPEDVYKKKKKMAVDEEKTLRQLVIDLLTKAVKKEG